MNTDIIIIVLGVVLVILLIAYPLLREEIFRQKANREGVSTAATIVRKCAYSTRGRYFWLLYSYSVNGLEHDRQERVPYSGYNAVEEGDQVKIIYLSRNPQYARIIDTRVKS